MQSPGTARPTIALSVERVTKVFGATVALWDVEFDVRSAELVAVYGTNGSGKTTLLRTIAGLIAPTRGRIAWATNAPERRSRVGLLGHATHLVPELTAIENVALAARLARRDEAGATGLLEALGVARYGGRRTAELSAGTRRRVGLARVLATDPDVLLADEPFAGLDESAADLVARVLGQARDDGRLVVVATHDATRRESIATRSVRLDDGRLRADAKVDPEKLAL